MNEILKVYVSLSMSASFLIVLLMVLRPLYQKRFSRRWQYYIWLVVIVRLVLPWNPGNGIVGHFFQEKWIETWIGKILEVHTEAGQENVLEETEAQKLSSQVFKKQTDLHDLMMADISTEDSRESSMEAMYDKSVWYQKIQMLLQNIWVLWLAAAFVLLIRKIIIYQSFVRFLKAGCMPVEDIERLEVLGKVMEQNQIRRMTGLYTNSLTASPLLIGFIHPNIILTKAQLSDKDFYYTILHELTHYKRRDMFYKWMVQFVVCLHWFNPLVYWMEREISKSCELSCDEAVMKNLDAVGRRQYGDTLLHAMGAGGVYPNTLAVMTLNESSELLKERLGAIMNDKKKTRFTVVLSAAAALILAGSAVVTGAYRQPAAAETSADQMQLSDCKMIQKGGEYYILCEGVDEQDMPTGGVTEGCVGITLVKKDEYTGIGPFDDMDRLVQDVTEMVTYMRRKKELTEAEAQVFIEAAEKIRQDASDVKINRTFVSLKKGKSITLKLTGTKKQVLASQNKDEVDAADNEEKAKKDAATAEVYQKWGITAKNGANPKLEIARLGKKDLPDKVQKAVDKCGAGIWYVMEYGGYQYIYYQGLSNDYAFEPTLSDTKADIKIVDMKRSGTYDVLLAVKKNVAVTIHYHDREVSCQRIYV